MVEFKIARTRGFRQPCIVCNGHTEKFEEPLVRLFEEGKETRYALCSACIAASPEERSARLLEKADATVRHAEALRWLAANLPGLPETRPAGTTA